jgi:hypothetical protein
MIFTLDSDLVKHVAAQNDSGMNQKAGKSADRRLASKLNRPRRGCQ